MTTSRLSLIGFSFAAALALYSFKSPDQLSASFNFKTFWNAFNQYEYSFKAEKDYQKALLQIKWLEENGNDVFPDMNIYYDAAVCCYQLNDSLSALHYLEKSVVKGLNMYNHPDRKKVEVGQFAFDSVMTNHSTLRQKYLLSRSVYTDMMLENERLSTRDQFVRSQIMRDVLDQNQLSKIISYVDSLNMAEHVACVKQGRCIAGGIMIYHLYGQNEKYFPFIDSCLRVELFAGRMMPSAYAFWYDRQLSYVQHIPQKYGCNVYYTEFKVGAKAKISEIESVDSVDFYRSQIGLPPLWQSAEISGFDLPAGYKKPN